MIRLGLIAGAAVLLVGGALAAAVSGASDAPPRDFSGVIGDVDRGAYVARLSGCIACHTDAKNGRQLLAGGPDIKTDFGVFRAPNITPHPEDGIGRWTLADFSRAVTDGRDPDGQHYYPAFPYAFYTRLSDQDVADLWAAVRSVPTVAGGPPPSDLGFPFSIREGLAVWKGLFFRPGELSSDGAKSDAWNRGRYLAEGPAHCGACHTPRNLLGGRDPDRPHEGGVGPGGEKIPPISASALREEGWTPADLAFALRTGVKPDGDVLGGSMAEVVRDSTRWWSDADLAALATYLFDEEAGT